MSADIAKLHNKRQKQMLGHTLKRKSGFTLRLNVAKSTEYIEKCLKQKFRRSKFLTKKSAEAYLYPP